MINVLNWTRSIFNAWNNKGKTLIDLGKYDLALEALIQKLL